MKITAKLGGRSLVRSGPPKRTTEQLASSKSDGSDAVEISELARPQPRAGISPGLKAALAGAALFSAFAGPAAAQTPPGAAPLIEETVSEVMLDTLPTSTALDLRLNSSDLGLDPPSESPRIGFQFSSVNDFMPNGWTSWLGGPQHKIPDGTAFDDDGWTAEVQLLGNVRRGNTEWVGGARLATITQPGSREPFGPDYRGLRTDLGEVIVQRNQRTSLSSELTLDYGVGGGLQAIGNVGGEDMQRWWHNAGIVGGRTGTDLQGTQMNEGRGVMPVLTGGAKLTRSVNPYLDLIGSGQATLPVGRGLGVAGLRAGIGTHLGPLDLEAGGKLDAVWTDAPEFEFHDPSGVRGGWYGRAEYGIGERAGLFAQLETGGIRNEPVLTMGFRIGLGGKPLLNPFW